MEKPKLKETAESLVESLLKLNDELIQQQNQPYTVYYFLFIFLYLELI